MEDELFRTDSAVFMPDVLDAESPRDAPAQEEQKRVSGIESLKVVFLFLTEHPDRRLLIAGHTDTVGEMRYNRDLSRKRARSVELLLVGGDDSRETWANDIASRKHHPKDIQHICKWASKSRDWDTDPGEIDGRYGQDTQKAIVAFHKLCKADLGIDVPARGQVTVDTWRGVFALYQDELKKLLAADDEEMASYRRNQLRWVHPIRHVEGCGENWPIDHAERNQYQSQTNRRVEVLFFDRSENPVFTTDPCQKETCPIYRGPERRLLPPHYGARPLTQPTFYAPDAPGSSNWIALDGLFGYVINFDKRGALAGVTGYPFKNGKLSSAAGRPVDIEGNRASYLYVSHRSDLANLVRGRWFKADRSGLPLQGPIGIPCGVDAGVNLDIWAQRDWIIVRAHPIEGGPDGAMLVEWSEDYYIGHPFGNEGTLEDGYVMGPIVKEVQEHWLAENGGGRSPANTAAPAASPLSLIPSANLAAFGRMGGTPIYVGTLSALPIGGTAQHPPPRSSGRLPEAPEAALGARGKVLLLFQTRPGEKHSVMSFNQLLRASDNVIVSHHTYDGALVDALAGLADEPHEREVDTVLRRYSPPVRALLPGDTCWASQKHTEHCGSFSMAAAMNYWYPRTNNPFRANGEVWVGRITQLPLNLGTTPGAIVDAATRWGMFARYRSGTHIGRETAEKLLKLWLWAGVPVVVNIIESGSAGFLGTTKNRHFKLAVGYDGDRFFFQNSGIDWESRNEIVMTEPYLHAPVGNDVDLPSDFHPKWESTTEGIIGMGAGLFTSARTFIPIYPRDPRFRGTNAR